MKVRSCTSVELQELFQPGCALGNVQDGRKLPLLLMRFPGACLILMYRAGLREALGSSRIHPDTLRKIEASAVQAGNEAVVLAAEGAMAAGAPFSDMWSGVVRWTAGHFAAVGRLCGLGPSLKEIEEAEMGAMGAGDAGAAGGEAGGAAGKRERVVGAADDLEAQHASLEVPPEPSDTEHAAGLEPGALAQTEQSLLMCQSACQRVRNLRLSVSGKRRSVAPAAAPMADPSNGAEDKTSAPESE